LVPATRSQSYKTDAAFEGVPEFPEEKRLEDVKARFDVVAIVLRPAGEEIELIRDAFDLKYL